MLSACKPFEQSSPLPSKTVSRAYVYKTRARFSKASTIERATWAKNGWNNVFIMKDEN